MTIPKHARYNYCCEMANEFIFKENINSFPFDADIIIKKYKWAKLKYSSLANKFNVNINDISDAYGSNDAYTIFNSRNYTIAYNDTIDTKQRIYFTKLHEIGHIYLKHFTEFNETILSRYNITKSKYKVLENEANCFARNVLAPASIVEKLHKPNSSKISNIFKITSKAAKTRLNFLNEDLYYLSYKNNINQLHQFHNFIYKKQCLNCGYSFISKNAKYCPICGHDKLIWGDGRMVYDDGYKLDENGKALTCPKCGNEQMEADGTYCRVCGTYLINKCSNDNGIYGGYDNEDQIKPPCGKIATSNARYCEYCGERTTFYNQNLLKDWDKAKAEIEEKQAQEEAAASQNNNEITSIDDGDIPF